MVILSLRQPRLVPSCTIHFLVLRIQFLLLIYLPVNLNMIIVFLNGLNYTRRLLKRSHLLFILFHLFHFCLSMRVQTQAPDRRLVIEEEGFYPQSLNLNPMNNGIYYTQSLRCPSGFSCKPVNDCTFFKKLIDQSCLQINSLRELTCGYAANAPFICCPHPPANTSSISINLRCGRTQINSVPNSNYRGLGSQPWVVKIGFKNSKSGSTEYPCCGSLISNNVILTSAHCALTKASNYKLATVRIGEYDASNNPDCTSSFCAHSVQDVDISHVIVHPGFEPTLFRHNIALVVLKKNVTYSITVQPVCLHDRPSMNLEHLQAKLVGWGKLPGQTVSSNIQQQLDLTIIPLDVCRRLFEPGMTITFQNLCVGADSENDPCSGFGGAPLVLQSSLSSVFYQVGLLSFGSERCGKYGTPAVYVKIAEYVEWIKRNSP